MNAATLFGWWGLNAWVPAYLNLGADRGGIGLSSSTMSLFVIAMQVGMWLGYVSFGYIADAFGRKRTYVTFLIVASVLLALYGNLRTPVLLLFLAVRAWQQVGSSRSIRYGRSMSVRAPRDCVPVESTRTPL